jgi:hypothetical protein
MVQSALLSAKRAEEIGLPQNRIILSAKVSAVQDLIAVYAELARRSDYALHLGLTEAGMGTKGIVASSAAMGVLLQQGIGDTIRISLTPEPGGDRTREVQVAQELLQTMGLRTFVPLVAACPGCGRTTSTTFQELASDIQSFIRDSMPAWKTRYPGVETLNVAVMGCIVNGPGESKHADIGISARARGPRRSERKGAAARPTRRRGPRRRRVDLLPRDRHARRSIGRDACVSGRPLQGRSVFIVADRQFCILLSQRVGAAGRAARQLRRKRENVSGLFRALRCPARSGACAGDAMARERRAADHLYARAGGI